MNREVSEVKNNAYGIVFMSKRTLVSCVLIMIVVYSHYVVMTKLIIAIYREAR